MNWRPWDGRTGGSFSLSCLKRRFLITPDQPDPFPQQHPRLLRETQHRACPRQKLLWVLEMLPRVRAPGTDAFRFEPAANGASRDPRQLGRTRHMTSPFASTPPSQRNPLALRQAASHSGRLCPYFRGKNASALQNGARRRENEWQPSGPSICAPVDRWFQRSVQRVDSSTLDGRGRPGRYAHGSPGSAQWHALGRDGGVVLPLPLFVQLDGLAWGLSWSFSSHAESPSLSGARQSRNDFMIGCTKLDGIIISYK